MDQRANRCGFQVEDQWGHCLGAPMSCLCRGNCFRRELPAGVVDGVGRIEDQLTDGHNGIPVVDQAVEDGRQGLRRVQRSVVEQHDAPRLHLGCYAPAYRIRVVVLPVQGVPIGKDLKPLRRKGLLVWHLRALGKILTCKCRRETVEKPKDRKERNMPEQGVKFLCKRAIENGQRQLTPVEKELLKKGIDDAKNFQDFLAVALAAMMAG